MNIPQKVIDICALLEDKKAEDIVVCDTTKMHNVADFFIIATGGSSAHINGICDYLEEKTSEMGYSIFKREGFILSNWVVLDFDNILVHLFTKEEREKYSLQKLISDGRNEYNLKKINTMLANEKKKEILEEKKKQEKEKRKENNLKKKELKEQKVKGKTNLVVKKEKNKKLNLQDETSLISDEETSDVAKETVNSQQNFESASEVDISKENLNIVDNKKDEVASENGEVVK